MVKNRVGPNGARSQVTRIGKGDTYICLSDEPPAPSRPVEPALTSGGVPALRTFQPRHRPAHVIPALRAAWAASAPIAPEPKADEQQADPRNDRHAEQVQAGFSEPGGHGAVILPRGGGSAACHHYRARASECTAMTPASEHPTPNSRRFRSPGSAGTLTPPAGRWEQRLPQACGPTPCLGPLPASSREMVRRRNGRDMNGAAHPRSLLPGQVRQRSGVHRDTPGRRHAAQVQAGLEEPIRHGEDRSTSRPPAQYVLYFLPSLSTSLSAVLATISPVVAV